MICNLYFMVLLVAQNFCFHSILVLIFARETRRLLRSGFKMRSSYAGHFDLDRKAGKATCKKCGQVLAYHGSTSGMHYHLKKKHDITLSGIEDEKDPQVNPSDGPTPAKKSRPSNSKPSILSHLKPTKSRDELLAEEATLGASFRYVVVKISKTSGKCLV